MAFVGIHSKQIYELYNKGQYECPMCLQTHTEFKCPKRFNTWLISKKISYQYYEGVFCDKCDDKVNELYSLINLTKELKKEINKCKSTTQQT